MLTPDQIDICEEFVARAQDIVNQELAWEMRRRYNTNPEEYRLHVQHQKMAWEKVKKIFCDNKDLILEYSKDAGKNSADMIESINNTVEEEVDALLLGDDSYYRNDIK